MNIILFGAPGAGKGTQAVELVKKYRLTHISTGEMFRNAIANKTEMGLLANTYIAKGNLVPDDVTVGVVKERLAQDDCKNGFILDGFPRTLPQAKCLDQICKELNIKIDYVIDIEVDSQELISRLSGRRVCKNCGNSYHVMFNKPKQENVTMKTVKPIKQEMMDVTLPAGRDIGGRCPLTDLLLNLFPRDLVLKAIDEYHDHLMERYA